MLPSHAAPACDFTSQEQRIINAPIIIAGTINAINSFMLNNIRIICCMAIIFFSGINYYFIQFCMRKMSYYFFNKIFH